MFNNLKKIGKIVGTHGLKGEIKFKLENNFILTGNFENKQFFLENSLKNLDVFEVNKSYFLNKKHIIAFENIANIDSAQKLINNIVYVKKDSEFVEEAFSYINFQCFYNGQLYGKVIDEMFNGAQDLIKLKTETNEFWIPCVDFYLKKVDVMNKEIYLKEIEVLL